jgi:hypothetical protein
MIDKELENKAKQYSSKYARQYYHNDKSGFTTSEEEVCKAYIAGAKENGVVWHNLKTNPKDLPKNQNEVLCLLWEDSYYIGYHHINSGMWCFDEFSLSKDENEDEVTAWCELPKFKEE